MSETSCSTVEPYIRKCYVYITNNLIVDDLLPHLYQNEIISYNQMEDILTRPTKYNRVNELMSIVLRSTLQNFKSFLEVLTASKQHFIAEEIKLNCLRVILESWVKDNLKEDDNAVLTVKTILLHVRQSSTLDIPWLLDDIAADEKRVIDVAYDSVRKHFTAASLDSNKIR